jgi:hypothetical protein
MPVLAVLCLNLSSLRAVAVAVSSYYLYLTNEVITAWK